MIHQPPLPTGLAFRIELSVTMRWRLNRIFLMNQTCAQWKRWPPLEVRVNGARQLPCVVAFVDGNPGPSDELIRGGSIGRSPADRVKETIMWRSPVPKAGTKSGAAKKRRYRGADSLSVPIKLQSHFAKLVAKTETNSRKPMLF